jgi:hypothetical protein
MCIYNISKDELKSALFEALDNIEGDFDRKLLREACKELAEEYEWT